MRFSDVDVYGHVNNVKYFEYLQEARVRLLAATGQLDLVVAQTDVDYRVPILLRPEPYDVWSRVSRIGRTSMTIDAEIGDGDTVLARSRVVMVFWDPATGRPVPPPAEARERLLALSGPEPPEGPSR